MDIAEITRLYWQEKKVLREIAEIAGVTIPAIRSKMDRAGVPRRTHSDAQRMANCPNLTDTELSKLYDSGLSQSEIGQMFGVTQSSIKNRMKKAGVASRGRALAGKKNGMFGRTHTLESREKIREANRKQFSDPKARERHAILTAIQIQNGRTGKSFNRLETHVATLLCQERIEFVQQYRLGRFLFDFFIPSSNMLVEVHGTFWHADPRKYSHDNLSEIQTRNVNNDAKKKARALADGFVYRVLWEHDVYHLADPLIDIRSHSTA